jgi:hypothetical protein
MIDRVQPLSLQVEERFTDVLHVRVPDIRESRLASSASQTDGSDRVQRLSRRAE